MRKGLQEKEETAPTGGAKSTLCIWGGNRQRYPKGKVKETMLGSCLLPLTPQGQEGTKLSTFLLSCLPQEPDQHEGED